MYSSNLIDRARGCLLGLAVGDALGTTSSRKEQIVTAYRRACRHLLELNEMRRERCPDIPKLRGFVARAAEDSSTLTVDPKPRLIVFGYTAEQRCDAHWPEHEKKIARQHIHFFDGRKR